MSDAPVELRADPEWGYTDLLLFFGLGILFFLGGFMAAAGVLSLFPIEGKGIRLLLSQFAGYAFMLIPLYLIFRAKFREAPLRLLRMGVDGRLVAPSISAGLMAAIGVLLTAVALRTPPLDTPMEEFLSDNASLIAAAVLGVTLGPWFEELLFRGLLQPVLIRTTGVVAGIVLSALPFALLHAPQYAWSWRHILLITLAGSAFGWRRYVTGSTGAAVVMHAAYNSLLFAGLVITRWTGADLPRTI